VKKKGSKWGSQANKQTMYLALKSRIESRARYAPEPARAQLAKKCVLVTHCKINFVPVT